MDPVFQTIHFARGNCFIAGNATTLGTGGESIGEGVSRGYWENSGMLVADWVKAEPGQGCLAMNTTGTIQWQDCSTLNDHLCEYKRA